MKRHFVNPRIYISGMGICCPLGNSLDEVFEAIRDSKSGIRPIQSFDCSRMTMRHAGEVQEIPRLSHICQARFRTWDRGTRMAMHAAHEAVRNAGLDVESYAPHRVGLCIGTSGSGQYQNARFKLDRTLPVDREMSFYLSRNNPHFQSSEVAATLRIQGPNLAIGAATAGSGIALATAMSWLRSDYVDAVVVGGSESFSLLNVLGFDQLGLTIPNPCTPFSGEPGMTFGEGAGFVVLETEASLSRRTITPHAELASAIIRADGFDPILFDPSGSGLARAISAALSEACCEPTDINWVRASGTGGRDQDLAESIAIKSVFNDPPPISSLESYLGHANGAGPAINLIASVLCLKANLIPATIGFTNARPGCDLDYVGDGHRWEPLKNVLCNTMAFGGTNCAMVVKAIEQRVNDPLRNNSYCCGQLGSVRAKTFRNLTHRQRREINDNDRIVITGVGLISPVGCGDLAVADRFSQPVDYVSTADRLMPNDDANFALVRDFSPRKICPLVKLRGIELLTQYAAGAVSLALEHSRMDNATFRSDRSGIVSAISRTSGSVFERLFSELQSNGFRPLVGRLMLRNGRFMIASQLAHWFDLRGFSSTLSLGVGAGLHGLIAGYQQLRSERSLDSMVVVACDELSNFTIRSMKAGGLISGSNSPSDFTANPDGIFMPAEGAVALVLERKSFADARGAMTLCEVAGCGLTFDGQFAPVTLREGSRAHWENIDSSGDLLATAMRVAIADADVDAAAIDSFHGNCSGILDWDHKEYNAVAQVLGSETRRRCVNQNIGFSEAASSLMNLAAAINWITHSQSSAGAKTVNRLSALVAASTEQGHNAAVVLRA